MVIPGYPPKGEYSCDFVDKTLLVCCFAIISFSWGVDTPINLMILTLGNEFLTEYFFSNGRSLFKMTKNYFSYQNFYVILNFPRSAVQCLQFFFLKNIPFYEFYMKQTVL